MKSFSVLGLLAALALPVAAAADDTTTTTYPATTTTAYPATTTDTSTAGAATTTTDIQPTYHDEDDDNGGGVGIGLHASTLGYGAELNFTASQYLVWRLDYNYYSDYSYTTTKEDIKYDAHLHLKSYGIAADWHPFGGIFLVSLGLFDNQNNIDAIGVPQQTYRLNGHVYRASDIGTLSGHITFNSVAPYLGLGWNTLGSESKGVGLEFGLGVFYQGSPKVRLTANGPISVLPIVQQDVLAQQAKMENDWSSYRNYPVVNLGLVFRF